MNTSLYLKCTFTDAEIRDFSQELARATAELGETENRQKETMAAIKADITALKSKQGELSRKITNGYEMRSVDCRVELNSPRPGWKLLYRTDTGKFVKESVMSDDELQRKLPLKLDDEPAVARDDEPDGDEAIPEQVTQAVPMASAKPPKRGMIHPATQ